jgi:hypothetical protein
MKYPVAALVVVACLLGWWWFAAHRAGQPVDNTPVTGLPWQIEVLPGGNTRVFGVTPGVTTLGEAMQLFGRDCELAIIAAPDEAGSLEAYYSHYSAGPITGSLILVMDVTPGRLLELRGRAYQDGGSRRYRLAPDDLPAAFQAPVRVLTFSPTFSLDEATAVARFGTPQAVAEVSATQKHLLYPEHGLDVALDQEGKELIQYMAPAAFTAWQHGLLPTSGSVAPDAPEN